MPLIYFSWEVRTFVRRGRNHRPGAVRIDTVYTVHYEVMFVCGTYNIRSVLVHFWGTNTLSVKIPRLFLC